ncbi:MAG: hypothetical protein NTY90_01375 [Candidatus Micrarchaeota archaeon]|nr:hypothetical protein [Candidatus Micrarchaeota archaeon]
MPLERKIPERKILRPSQAWSLRLWHRVTLPPKEHVELRLSPAVRAVSPEGKRMLVRRFRRAF